jgi:hypothetical protein
MLPFSGEAGMAGGPAPPLLLTFGWRSGAAASYVWQQN